MIRYGLGRRVSRGAKRRREESFAPAVYGGGVHDGEGQQHGHEMTYIYRRHTRICTDCSSIFVKSAPARVSFRPPAIRPLAPTDSFSLEDRARVREEMAAN